MAILDTDFLSSFLKIGKIRLVLKVLNISYIIIPSTVYEELKNAPFFEQYTSLFAFNERDISKERFVLVKKVNFDGLVGFTEEEKSLLGKGEVGCFILGKENDDLILMDDSPARIIAKKKGLKVISVPSFLMYSKMKGIILLSELKEIIEALKAKDYYEFSEEIKESLLKE